MIISVGSGSAIKRKAVASVWPQAKIICYPVPSEIPEQPVGEEQTLQGAKNRARNALKESLKDYVKPSFVVGIENGMWLVPAPENIPDDEKCKYRFDFSKKKCWVDGAAIVLMDSNYKLIDTLFSETIFIPEVHEMGPDSMWSNLKDPHSVVTGKPRSQYLAETLAKMKERLEQIGGSPIQRQGRQ